MESGGHWCAVNAAALALLDLDAATPGLDRDAAGTPTGVLAPPPTAPPLRPSGASSPSRWASNAPLPPPPQEAAGAHGVTTLHTLDDLENVQALLACQDQLAVHVVPYTQWRGL